MPSVQDDPGSCGPVPAAVVVVVSSFLSNLIYGGITYAGGIFYDNFIETFNAGKFTTAWIISLQNLILYLTGLLGGPLSDMYGTRVVAIVGSVIATASLVASAFANSIYFLYMSFGVSAGVGFGLIHVANMIVVQQHTTRMRVLAAATSLTGSVCGGFIVPFIVRWSMDVYGWRGCQLILAGAVVHCLPCALLTRSPPKLRVKEMEQNAAKEVTAGKLSDDCLVGSEVKTEKISSKGECRTAFKRPQKLKRVSLCLRQTFDLRLLSDPICLLCAIGYCFKYGAVLVPYAYIPSKARVEGIPAFKAAMLISILSIGEVIGRLASGFMASIRQEWPAPICIASSILSGFAVISIAYCHTYTSLIAISALCGLMFGVAMGTASTVVRDMVGLERYPKMIGIAFGMAGIGSVISNQILAALWESTNSMISSFAVGGSFRLWSALVFGIVLFLKRREKRERFLKEVSISGKEDVLTDN